MKNIKRKLEGRKILYDGVFTDDLNSITRITVNSESEISFSPKDFKGNKFENLFSIFTSESINKIIHEEKFSNKPPEYLKKHLSEMDFNSLKYNYYRFEDNLGLEYFIQNNFLFVFTFGEKQPYQWILVLEGIWEIE